MSIAGGVVGGRGFCMETRLSLVRLKNAALSAEDRLWPDIEERSVSVLGGSGGGVAMFGGKDGVLGLENDDDDGLKIFPFNTFAR